MPAGIALRPATPQYHSECQEIPAVACQLPNSEDGIVLIQTSVLIGSGSGFATAIPTASICSFIRSPLGASEQRGRDGEAKCPSRLEIDYHLDLCRLLH